ncbi:MAG TPA: aminopeptidase P family N-terminal domain-containing protein, partial [Chloroflexota bacterium]|nr:aminopeptidase P family N-terminal domain-containing protein [Chloroflexota bacterium]
MYFITDWTERVDFDLIRRQRWQRTKEMMAVRSLGGLILFKYQNIRYASGMRPLWFPIPRLANAAVCAAGMEAPMVLVTGGDIDHRRATMSWIPKENVRQLPPLEDPAGLVIGLPILKAALRDSGITAGKVGIDITSLPLLEALQQDLPEITFVDADAPLAEVRAIKSEEEVKLFKSACLAVEAAFPEASDAVRVGVRECEILGATMKALYSYGMEIPQCNSIVASGDNLAPIAR